MNSKKVVVLLSTYNGEKYVKKQIKSILAQTYSNISLIIRDDGSTDNTCTIIKDLESKDSRITFIQDGKNLGYPACFYYLTDNAPIADYYFFCDQDDYWLKNKIEHAVSIFEKQDSSIPIAYYSRYIICDEHLNKIQTSPVIKNEITLKKALFEVCGLEFTMAINRSALILLNQNKPSFCSGRGTWMCMLYASLGKIICDDYVSALYRRHNQAVTSSSMNGIGLFLWRLKNFFFNDGFKDYKEILSDFQKTVGPKLDTNEMKMLEILSATKYFPNALHKIFYPHRLRSRFLDEIFLRVTFILGKL